MAELLVICGTVLIVAGIAGNAIVTWIKEGGRHRG
jgi:hypothetical protein